MPRPLLICAAIDLAGGQWFSPCQERIVASLRLGRAGDIGQALVPGAMLAVRADAVPGTTNPRIRRFAAAQGEDGGVTLLAGRIMEGAALRAQLGLDPQADDAATYAAAHRRWGAGCDAMITGEYAAIQWFARERRVRLARSPLAAPPLHLWRSGTRLVAASLPRSILAAGVRAEIDPDRIADVALFNFGDGSASYYKGLARVACGSWQEHRPDGQASHRYWSLADLPQHRFASEREALDAVGEQLRRAVSAGLEGVRRPAIALSGGLDSQLLACHVLDALPAGARLPSFTAVPVGEWVPRPDPRLTYDESGRVRELARLRPALDPAFITAREACFGEDLHELVTLSGWPSFNEMNMHWVHAISRAAAGAHCDVLFDGDFGDAGISHDGLSAYPAWLRQGRWLRLLGELRAARDGRTLWRRAVSLAGLPHLPPAWRARLDRWRGYGTSPFASWCPLDPDSAIVRAALERALAKRHDLHFHPPRSTRAARAAMLAAALAEGAEVTLGLRLMHGIETRSPLGFRPLFELCAGLPDEYFLRHGRARWLARRLAEGLVAPAVAQGYEVGLQAADFLGRAARDGAAMLASIERIAPHSTAGSVIDLPRIRRDLAENRGPESLGPNHWLRLTCSAARGIALARFVQSVEGGNDG